MVTGFSANAELDFPEARKPGKNWTDNQAVRQ
jgi:hypothetical protein